MSTTTSLRIVTITPKQGYTLEADERILEKRSSYGEVISWDLLISKGGPVSDPDISVGYPSPAHLLREEARDAARDARDAQMRKAFAAGFAAFAQALGSPSA
jgi:hypothetical protein